MNVLIGCEYSGVVRSAFADRGHNAMSCDLIPTEAPGSHYQGDIFECLRNSKPNFWDLIIVHPDCHYMSVSGNRWYAGTKKRQDAIDWTVSLYELCTLSAPRVALENPVSVLWKHLGGATQYIHPWEYGHKETKKTGLKLHNLPKLKPTDVVGPPPEGPERKEWERVWRMPPSPNRSKERARFLPGWAEAMAEQWG